MKKFKKLFAALMAAAMMMALCVVGASAVSADEVTNIKGQKTYGDLIDYIDSNSNSVYYVPSSGADAGSYVPVAYTYSQSANSYFFGKSGQSFGPYDGATYQYATYKNKSDSVDMNFFVLNSLLNTDEPEEPGEPETPSSDVIEGPEITKNVKVADGITNPATDFTYTFTSLENAPALSPVTVSVAEGAKTGSAKINLAGLKDAANGTYKYTFTETAANPTTGWSFDESIYYLTVNKLADGTYNCFIKLNNQGNKTNATFENTYKTTASLSLTKQVENTDFIGEDAEYSFKINFTASSTDSIPSEGFVATKGATETLNVKDGDTVTLKNGETLTFASLPAGIKYSIEETNANGAKSTTWRVDTDDLPNATKIDNRLLADDDAVVVTNTFDKSETGLATRIAPFVAMAVLAGGAVAAYFVVARKRQENE